MTESTIHIRVPATTKARWVLESRKAGMKLADWIVEKIEGKTMKAWTDYPFTWLGDAAGEKSPIREIEVVSFDGDKYCHIRVSGGEDSIKACYIYQKKGRFGEVDGITKDQLKMLEIKE